MPKDEVVGFVGMNAKEIASLDGIPCHVCGAIMVQVAKDGYAPFWACQTCGATTGCTEEK